MNESKECVNLIDLDEQLEENSVINNNPLTLQTQSLSSSSLSLSPKEISTQLMDFSNSDDVPSLLPDSQSEDIKSSNQKLLIMIPGLLEQQETELSDDPFETKPISCLNNNPFDLLENEVCKHLSASTIPHASKSMGIKTAKLLAISDDELLSNDEEEPYQKENDNDNNVGDEGKTIDISSNFILNVINSKSNSQTLLDSQSNDGSDTSIMESDSTDTSLNLENPRKKNKSSRTQLLKLSLTNSASSFNQIDSCAESKGTPNTKNISQRSLEPMLSTESPLKLMDESDSDEDNFEADLKLLTIPMLNEIDNSSALSPPISSDAITLPPPTIDLQENSSFEAIKAKLFAKRAEGGVNTTPSPRSTDDPKEQDINLLIHNLQSLISEDQITNESRRNQATELLDKLRNTLSTKNIQDNEKTENDCKSDKISESKVRESDGDSTEIESGHENIKDSLDDRKGIEDNITAEKPVTGKFLSPAPIKREGTFDIEMSTKTKDATDEISSKSELEVVPNCMISSSATYDGDTNEEKAERLNLPEIEPVEVVPPPESSADVFSPAPISPMQPDVNEIVEQLGKLLSQQTPIANNVNPQQTVIVVMNTPTPTIPKQNLLQTFSMEPTTTSQYSPRKSLLDLETPQSMEPRRRSQSLSIHDKMQIFQFPLQPVNTQLHSSQEKNVGNELPSNIASVSPSKNMNSDNNFGLRTPRLLRRNSYSNGSRSNISGIGNSAVNSGIASRRSLMTPDTRNSIQLRPNLLTTYEGVVTPQTTSIKLPTKQSFLKPDLKLKKPVRQSTESIMSSSKPLKATIPVKKVAPSLAQVSPITTTVTTIASSTTFKPGQFTLSSMDEDYQSPRDCSTPAGNGSSYTGRRNSFGMSSSIRSRYSLTQSSPSPMVRSSVSSSSGGSANSGTNRTDTGLKRRSLTDFKAKSPIKPRVSSTTMSKIAASNTKTVKLSNVKAADKLNVVKETSKITRLNGPLSSYRNKENRHP